MDEFTVQGHQENDHYCSQQSSSTDVKQKSEIAMDLTKYFFFFFRFSMLKSFIAKIHVFSKNRTLYVHIAVLPIYFFGYKKLFSSCILKNYLFFKISLQKCQMIQ